METSLCVDSLADSLVYITLSQATSQDVSVFQGASEKLSQWETQPGFYTSLCNIVASSKEIEVPVRWLATVCMKNGIDKFWRKNAPNAISENEKGITRFKLIKCIDEPSDVIALQLAVLIAKISRYDWPREWPELIDVLINNIKENGNEIRRYRSLLILSHVVKTLSTKRLVGDKKLFCELTSKIFPVMFEFWNYTIDIILSADAEYRHSMKFRYDLEMGLWSAKILSKLTVYGHNKPHLSPEAMNFMGVIFEKTKTLLQFRLTLIDEDERCKNLIEKHSLTLIKVLFSVLENHPLSYVDFVLITLQHSFYYCFTDEGYKLLFDSILIRWLNLMKAILLCPEYKNLTRSQPDTSADIIEKVKETKTAFFTPVIAHEIFYKLVNDYFILNENDLNAWDADPEAYAAEKIGESWKYDLKPCVEGLFKGFLKQYDEILLPIILNFLNSNKASPDPNDMVAILKKDAVYNVFGLSVFELFDEIDFDEWFSKILLPELHVISPNYRILRRRIAWLLGRWTGMKLAVDLHPVMYSEIINLLEPSEDMAVRLAAANTIKDVVDDFNFRSKVFLEFIPRCFQLLYTLLEQSEECETKMQVLTLLSFIIERVGWEIAPYFDSLVNYLPLLWQHSVGHNMLRCAIVSVLTQIVKGLGDQCVTLERFVILVIELSLDAEQEGHVYLLEDGLHLFLAYVENIQHGDKIFPMFNYLPHLIETSTEHLKVIIGIATSMLVLSPDNYLQMFGTRVINVLLDLLPDIKYEAVIIILEFFETCIKVRPYDSTKLLINFLQNSLMNIDERQEKASVISIRLSIFARIILVSNELFAEVVEGTSNKHNFSRDIVFGHFLDSWTNKMNIVWPPERRKLLGLALINLLTAGSSIVLVRFNAIVNAAVEVLNDILLHEGNGIYTDSLIFVDNGNNVSSEIEEQEVKTCHEIRISEITANDPVHKVDFSWYIRSQFKELEKQIGEENFQQLIDLVTKSTMYQINVYLNNL